MRNIEVLRDYFLGKDPQLRETLADNSLRLIGYKGECFVLKVELQKALQDLKEELEVGEIKEDIEELQRIVGDLQETVSGIQSDYVSTSDLSLALSNYYTKSEIIELLQNVSGLKYEVVEQLPTQNIKTDTIYLVPHGQGDEDEVKKLTGNIVLVDGSLPTLEEGLYYTGYYGVYLTSDASLNNVVYGVNETFYYDGDSHNFTGSVNTINYLGNIWEKSAVNAVEQTVLTNNVTNVPSSSILYEAIQDIPAEKAVITAYLSDEFIPSGAGEAEIPFDEYEYTGKTGLLTLNNNKIVIGNGVSKIKVSGKIDIKTSMANKKISLYSTTSAHGRGNPMSIVGFSDSNCDLELIGFGPIFSVSPGDEIDLRYASSSDTDTVYADATHTFLTVEVVECDSSSDWTIGDNNIPNPGEGDIVLP